MPFHGCGPSSRSTRARYGTPTLSALRLACALALSVSYTRAHAQAPAKAVGRDAAEPASVAEARGLAARRAPGAKARVRELLRGESDAAARARLASVLGALPKKDLAPADFDEALADRDARVRNAALTAMAKLGGAEAESRLTAALGSDPSAGVRMNAAFWLGQPSHRGAAAALGRALGQDKDPNVRVAAAQALTRLDSAAARRELRRGAGDADERVRRWAK